jgi:hypothetical protein
LPESLGGDEDAGRRLGQDLAKLFTTVKVHDRPRHRTEERRGPERAAAYIQLGN